MVIFQHLMGITTPTEMGDANNALNYLYVIEESDHETSSIYQRINAWLNGEKVIDNELTAYDDSRDYISIGDINGMGSEDWQDIYMNL